MGGDQSSDKVCARRFGEPFAVRSGFPQIGQTASEKNEILCGDEHRRVYGRIVPIIKEIAATKSTLFWKKLHKACFE